MLEEQLGQLNHGLCHPWLDDSGVSSRCRNLARREMSRESGYKMCTNDKFRMHTCASSPLDPHEWPNTRVNVVICMVVIDYGSNGLFTI